ncbi:MAG: hypothetical protein HY296_04520 [Thaumarchaeota archaeon]|nr:hypothetical protein [Nitrososphaerota archaeon]
MAFVLRQGGIIYYPSIWSAYFAFWGLGVTVVLVTKLVIGFFLKIGAILGNFDLLITFLLPVVPAVWLEIRRRRKVRNLTLEEGVAAGYAKLIPWSELAQVRMKRRRWALGEEWTWVWIEARGKQHKLLTRDSDVVKEYIVSKVGGRVTVE